MSRWTRLALVVIVVWMAAVALWTTRPWSDTVALVVPPKVQLQTKDKAPAFATYECSDLLGAPATPTPHGTVRYPPARPPCTDLGQRRALAVADLVLGVVALGAVVATSARRRSHPAAA